MTTTMSPTTSLIETKGVSVYAFPPARNVQTVERLLGRYLALWQAHGYEKAKKLFEVRYANPIRRRLASAGVPAKAVEHEIGSLKIAMRLAYCRQIANRQKEHQA